MEPDEFDAEEMLTSRSRDSNPRSPRMPTLRRSDQEPGEHAASTPGSSTPSRRWSTKRARSMFVAAVSKVMAPLRSGRRSKESGPLRVVTVGPVIGKVTSTTARVLVEVDKGGPVKVVLQEDVLRGIKEERNGQSSHKVRKSKALEVEKILDRMRPGVFVFKHLKPGTKYLVEVANCRCTTSGSFRTFSLKPSDTLNVGVISCNKIFITQQAIPIYSDLWAHLAKSVEAGDVDILVHLGDQIYGDGDKRLDADAGADYDKWSNRFRSAKAMLEGVPNTEWKTKQDEICERYREVYRDTWNHHPTAKCLANAPNLMIYDDHEVRDNWGDISSDWETDTVDYFVAYCAWLVNLEYQRQLHEDVDITNPMSINKDYHFHIVNGVGLMFLDIRGSRTFHRMLHDKKPYLGSHQWEDIHASLAAGGLFDDVRALLVCSPAPLVFLEPRITNAAGKVVHRLEDFKGHWSAQLHVKEQTEMIECLYTWKKSRRGREVLVLGGDVHCGGHSDILKDQTILFRQLTTSAIANMPLPKSAYYFMRVAGRLGILPEGNTFRHHHWTRSRNYGLVQIKQHSPEDHEDNDVTHKEVEVSAQLIIGKLMTPVKIGKKMHNLPKPTPTRWYTCYVN